MPSTGRKSAYKYDSKAKIKNAVELRSKQRVELRRQKREHDLDTKRDLYSDEMVRELLTTSAESGIWTESDSAASSETGNSRSGSGMSEEEMQHQAAAAADNDPLTVARDQIGEILMSIATDPTSHPLDSDVIRQLLEHDDEGIRIETIEALEVLIERGPCEENEIQRMIAAQLFPILSELIYMASYRVQVAVSQLTRQIIRYASLEQLAHLRLSGILSALVIMLVIRDNEVVMRIMDTFILFVKRTGSLAALFDSIQDMPYVMHLEHIAMSENEILSAAAIELLDASDRYEKELEGETIDAVTDVNMADGMEFVDTGSGTRFDF